MDIERIKQLKKNQATDRMPRDQERLNKVKQEVPELHGMDDEKFLSRLDEPGETDPPELQEITVLERKKNGHYRDDDRFVCVKFLEAFQRFHGGDLKPNFAKVSRLWGVPIRTLMDWWDKREEITRNQENMIDAMDDVVQSRVTAEYLRLLDAAAQRDYTEMTNRDFISMLEKMTAIYRLATNKSTENVHVGHTVQIQSAAPEGAEDGNLPPGMESQE